MINLFHKYQKPIMLVVTVMMIIAFVVLYNGRSFEPQREADSYEVYGRKVSQHEIDKAVRRFQVAQYLGLNNLVAGLAGQAFSQEQAMENFVWNGYVLDREAKKLGIDPTVEEMKEVLIHLPVFQTNNQFDPAKYEALRQNMLFPNGFTDAQLEDLVRDELRIKRLIDLVGSTVDVTPAEFKALYTRNNQKTEVSLVRFPLKAFSDAVTPTEEEIQKYFEAHKAQLLTEEKRVVSFVEIDLSEDEKKLTGKERVDALQKKSDLTRDFGQALVATNDVKFADAAAKFGLKVKTTEEFTPSTPAKDLAANPEAVAAANKLTEAVRFSDPVSTETGFIVLNLDKIVPARPLTLEEAKPRIVEAIKKEKGQSALVTQANEARTKIEAALQAGKSFTAAAEEAGVKVESFPAFSLAQPVEQPDANRIAEASMGLKENGLSPLVTTQTGGLLIHVDKRLPIDESKMAADEKEQMVEMRNLRRYAAFIEWMNLQRAEANPRSLRPVTSQETEG